MTTTRRDATTTRRQWPDDHRWTAIDLFDEHAVDECQSSFDEHVVDECLSSFDEDNNSQGQGTTTLRTSTSGDARSASASSTSIHTRSASTSSSSFHTRLASTSSTSIHARSTTLVLTSRPSFGEHADVSTSMPSFDWHGQRVWCIIDSCTIVFGDAEREHPSKVLTSRLHAATSIDVGELNARFRPL
jgi:hypothetical protein